MKAKENKIVAPKPKHCPNCVFYYNGMKMTDKEGRLYFFPQPGLRLLRFSGGPIYDRIGVVVPCECPAASGPNEAYKDTKNQWLKNYLSKGNYSLYIENQHKEINVGYIKNIREAQ